MRTLATRVALAAAALAFAATAMAADGSASAPKISSVAAAKSRFGTILFDGRGFVLYAFTRDTRGRSACSGACAKAWPPYLVTGKLIGRAGIAAERLATIRRSDGSRQATYAGKPLYYYVGDRKPRQILCQNVSEFGGLWLVVRPNGTVVR
jgi:predicted lipoprotein with Yx(FWY)xxD motif